MRSEKGSALLTFIVVGGFILGLTAVTYFMVQRALQVQGAVQRAVLAYESALGGMDVLFYKENVLRAEQGDTVRVVRSLPHGYQVDAQARRVFSVPIPGSSLLFAMGYESIGSGAVRGGTATYILGLSQARGGGLPARSRLEALYVQILGLP